MCGFAVVGGCIRCFSILIVGFLVLFVVLFVLFFVDFLYICYFNCAFFVSFVVLYIIWVFSYIILVLLGYSGFLRFWGSGEGWIRGLGGV